MSTFALKDARMELKTTHSLKVMLKNAASLLGQDLTSSILASAEDLLSLSCAGFARKKP